MCLCCSTCYDNSIITLVNLNSLRKKTKLGSHQEWQKLSWTILNPVISHRFSRGISPAKLLNAWESTVDRGRFLWDAVFMGISLPWTRGSSFISMKEQCFIDFRLTPHPNVCFLCNKRDSTVLLCSIRTNMPLWWAVPVYTPALPHPSVGAARRQRISTAFFFSHKGAGESRSSTP